MIPALPAKSLLRSAATLALAAASCAAPAAAQEAEAHKPAGEEGAGNQSSSTRSTFLPEEFARFAPRTAFDMARNVPGFAIRGDDGARGLGQADTNVLVNGRRISGKSNGPVEALRRIPIEDVVRLELVDGASLEIGGLTGQVLNVVTRSSGQVTGQFRYNPQIRSRGTPPRLFEGRVGLAGGGTKTAWTLALSNESQRRGNDGPEEVFDGAGRLTATRAEKLNQNNDRISASGSFNRKADGGQVLNVNGQVQGFISRETERSRQFGIDGAFQRLRQFRKTEDEFSYEVGADYEFGLGGGRLKLIGFRRYEDSPSTSRVTTEFAASPGTPQVSLFETDAGEGETILRSEYTVPAGGGSLVVAIEGVKNFLEINSARFASDAAGALQPVPFPGASARVEEDRAEGSVTWSRALSPRLNLQASAGAEFSRISQTGPGGLTRQFVRPKGFVSLDWQATNALNLSGRIERFVGQLNFFDFIASVDLDQDRTDVTNARLVPPQNWNFELEANLKLGALGSFNLSGSFEDVTDIVDQIPIPGGGQAPGNIPSARFYNLDGDLTLLSDSLGWKGTRMDLRFSLGASEVRDPLLGYVREVSDNEIATINASLRHDVPGSAWAAGTSVEWRDNAANVRLDEISRSTRSFGLMRAFVENKDVAGMTVRLQISNLVNQKDRFERTVFADRRAGTPSFSERRVRTLGVVFSLDVEGSF